MTALCDTLYAEESSTKSRAAHHIETIALGFQLISADKYADNDEEIENPQLDIDLQVNEHHAVLHFNPEDINTVVENFSSNADAILDESLYVFFTLCSI